MNVHLRLPDRVEFTPTDRYEPEPEPAARQWGNTWHLTAGTPAPAQAAQFLAVLLVHRQGQETSLPKVELLTGTGAVGGRLTARDGGKDIVAFRTDPAATTVTCGGLESPARVFAQSQNATGRTVRSLIQPRVD